MKKRLRQTTAAAEIVVDLQDVQLAREWSKHLRLWCWGCCCSERQWPGILRASLSEPVSLARAPSCACTKTGDACIKTLAQGALGLGGIPEYIVGVILRVHHIAVLCHKGCVGFTAKDFTYPPHLACACPSVYGTRFQTMIRNPEYNEFLDFMCPAARGLAMTPPPGTNSAICPRAILGTWDDHDFGWNDGDGRLEQKWVSQAATAPRGRGREGGKRSSVWRVLTSGPLKRVGSAFYHVWYHFPPD